MTPTIEKTRFGSITIEGKSYKRDVIIRQDGQIKKRKKKLSKALYGTSHILSLEEAKHVLSKGGQSLIIGTGQFGRVRLSQEAEDYFHQVGCAVKLLPTPQAIKAWNEADEGTIGLFHITC
jgi:hypothetical protein